MLHLTSRQVALIGMFAALYVIFSFMPGIPVATAQIKIEIEACLASVFGVVLGPYLGSLTALVSAVVAWIIPSGGGGGMGPYGMPFLLSPFFNALVTGLTYTGKWKEAMAVFGVLIAAFWFLPPSQPLGQFYYVGALVTWDKLIALALILPAVLLMRKGLSTKTMPLAFFLLAFAGNEADNAWGCIAFATPIVYNGIFGLNLDVVRFLFTVSPLVYPTIRFIQAVIATIILVPLVKALKMTNLTFVKVPWNSGAVGETKSP